MGKIIIQKYTTNFPITMMGEEAAICVGADGTNDEKNYKRGIDCLESGHGRVLEYPDLYIKIEGYSARVIREFYTHIGGLPTRLQQSTRYGLGDEADFGFKYVIPDTIKKYECEDVYETVVNLISNSIKTMEDLGVPREDATMILPLCMQTKIVVKMNFRTFFEMCKQRLCSRAFWEYRDLMNDIIVALSEYSEEWKYLVENYCKPKCEHMGFCVERKSCGRKPKQN